MPRIRTIKPEFWADEKIAKLPRDARLMFVGMWNFADDDGRLRGSPLLIRSQIFPYDSEVDSESLLRSLVDHSLIVRYEVDGESLIWIKNFRKHQKIDRPQKSALPPPPNHSPKPRRTIVEPSTNEPRASHEGSSTEWNGMEGNGSGKGSDPPAPQAATGPVWEAYSKAFEERHGVGPPASAKVRSQLKQFLTRVPKDDAPAIAAFYVRHNQALYVSAKHPVDLLLRDAQKLFAEWKTGRMGTGVEARQTEETQARANVFTKLLKGSG